jgi:GT2 family glycosyltransferase
VYPRPLKTERDRQFPAARYCGAGHALRREALEKTSLYDENLFFYWEELDMSYQMIDAGYSIVYDPEVVILHKVSPEARTNWSNDRFYFLVRNALYLDFKYYASIRRVLVRAAGYLVKGIWNRVPSQVVTAYRDAFRLCRSLSPSRTLLGKDAREYVHRHDTLPRGSFHRRVRDEVLERLP